jgi:aspartate aminotransferase
MTKISSRMGQFRPSPTASTSELVRRLRAEGQDIIGLVGGEPDFPTPDTIKQAGIRAIETNNTRYTDVDGTPELRKALSEKFKRENGLDYAPDQIVVTNGTKPLLHAALMAMTDPGDEVIIPAPHWVSHPDITRIVGAVPVSVPCPPETGFRLAPAALEAAITPRTRVLILNSPNNPTGTAYSADDLRGIIAVLKRHPGIWVLTDEIYEHIRFDDVAVPSIAALDPEIAERTVTANGFSKGYVMTGWRVGFAGGPRPMMKARPPRSRR